MRKLALCVALSALAGGLASAETVSLHIDPGMFSGQYTVYGDAIFTGATDTTVTVGQSYAVLPYNQANAGSFTVVDNGNSTFTVNTTNSAGLMGSSSTSSPMLSFNNTPVTYSRGPNYQGSLGWWGINAYQYGNFSEYMPLGTSGQEVWYAAGDSPNVFYFGVDSTGKITASQPSSGAQVSISNGTISLPTAQSVSAVTPSGSTYTIPGYAAGLNSSSTPLYLVPGTYDVIPDISGATPSQQSFVVPNSLPWSQTLTFSANGNDYTYTFGATPEPASLGLLALGAVGLLARRRGARRC